MHERARAAPASPVTLKRDVAYDLVYYLRENQGDSPGSSVERVFVRRYPKGTLAAHIFGYVREVDRGTARRSRATRASSPATRSARTGSSTTYDQLPARDAGRDPDPGRRHRRADGGRQLVSQRPVPGNNLQLTIDTDVQARRRGGARPLRPAAAPSWRWMSTTARSSAWARSRPSTRPSSPADDLAGQFDATLPRRRPARRSSTARSRASTRPARPSSSITALAALEDGRDHARRGRSTTRGSLTVGGSDFKNAGDVAQRRDQPADRRSRSPRTSTSTCSASRMGNQGRAPGLGPQPRHRPRPRDRPARRGRRAAADAGMAQRALPPKATGPPAGRRATTSTSRSARATCRPTRCRWRSPTRRSATAATSSPPRRQWKSRIRRPRVLKEFDPPPQRRSTSTPPTGRRSSTASTRPRRSRAAPPTSLRRLPRRHRRQDRNRGAARPTRTSPGTPRSRPTRTRDRHRGDHRGRRLRRRRRGPGGDDPRRLLHKRSGPGRRRSAEEGARMNVRHPQPPRPARALRGSAPASPSASASPTWTAARLLRRRPGRLQRLHARPDDPNDIPGDPGYFVDRQTIYACTRHRRHVRSWPASTTRGSGSCGSASTRSYASASFWSSFFGFAARGSRRAFDLPFFSFQPSELGKLLLSSRACRVRDRWRQARFAEAAHGALPLPGPGAGCARLPAAGPRHLPGVRGHHPRRHVRGGRPLDALRGDRRGPRRTDRTRPRGGSGSECSVAAGLPAGATHVVPDPSADPSDAGYQQNQAKTAIGAGEISGRGDRATQTRLEQAIGRT